MLLKGKNIIVTGSGRGIGKSVAIACAKEGANIGLISRTLDELEDTKQKILDLNTGGKVAIKIADVTKFEDIENALFIIHHKHFQVLIHRYHLSFAVVQL